jgi:hypothetical protein
MPRLLKTATKPVTLERVREVVDYNSVTGAFIARINMPRRPAGEELTRIDPNNGYRYISIDGGEYLAARIAWLHVYGVWPSKTLRMQNRDKADCRIANLAEGYLNPKWPRATPEGRAAYAKAYREANREALRDTYIRRVFGIDLAVYTQKLMQQKGVCAICKQPEINTFRGRVRALAIDHDHRTGAIRDLLCYNCNNILGQCNDDPDRLRACIDYLERHALPENVVPLKGA